MVVLVIDCPPGNPRPIDILSGLCIHCSLDQSHFVLKSQFFGEWSWEVEENYLETYKLKIDDIGKYLKNSYHSGEIRYAEW